MAFFRARVQCLLSVTFCSSLSVVTGLSSDPAGVLLVVGNAYGWQYLPATISNTTSLYNYQTWSDAGSYYVEDGLDFGNYTGYSSVVMHVPWDVVENCSTSGGILVPHEASLPTYFYFHKAGKFGFISPDYCEFGVKFTITVSEIDPGILPPPTTVTRSRQKSHYRVPGCIAGVLVTGLVLILALIVAFIKRRSYWDALEEFFGRQVRKSFPSYPTGQVSDSHFRSFHSKDVEAAADSKSGPWGPQRYSYKELMWATKSFKSSLVIGQGGFGTVYKGYLSDSSEAIVAVKRLSPHALQGVREFLAEVNIISQLRHRNLVPLLGWCDENEELILVYEYMPNGDLDNVIFGSRPDGHEGLESSPFAWKYRYNTFCGMATALVYLHEEWEQRVVHRDVKTSNVMLDSQFNARLGDFGLARLSEHSQAPRTTVMAGTIGYLAPEFNLTGRATDKTDVYAFGVVVLEVSCAKRALAFDCILVDWVWDLHKEEKLLDAIDPELDVRSISDEEEMKRAVQLGLLCCHPDPPARPTMRDALNILTGKTPLPKMPRSKPVAVFEEDLLERSFIRA